MTRTSKQWATTGFIIGVGSALGIAALVFVLARNSSQAVAQPIAQPIAHQAAAGSAPAVAPPSGKTLLGGTITLDSTSFKAPAVVFIIARGDTKGHPVLAKRLDVTSFPVQFTLTDQDSMMQASQELPSKVVLEARIDTDGDAITKEPGAPAASVKDVAIGTSDAQLKLQ